MRPTSAPATRFSLISNLSPVLAERTVAASRGRTATVEVPEGKDAEVVEIDWGITEQDHDLRDRFIELLLKNTADKLKNDYMVSAKMWKGAHDLMAACKKKVRILETENEKLKKLNTALKKKLNI